MPNSTPQYPAAPERDRFVAFAFAAAELLVEIEPRGLIVWADGAFVSRFGAPAESFIGRPVQSLVAAADRVALARGLTLAAMHGRLAPTIIHLADRAATECALGVLALPGAAGRLCLTFATLPRLAPVPQAAEPGSASLTREAEASLRAGQPASLGLLDLSGWASASAVLPTDVRQALTLDIAATLTAQGGPGAMVTEIAQGRIGVLGDADLDLPCLIAAIEAVVRLVPVMAHVGVSGLHMPLDAAGTEPGRATRALRYALASFAKGGLAALAGAGFTDGLSGFLATADARATALANRIAARRFRLAFQPIVALADRKIHHFEALLRPLPDPNTPSGRPAISAQEFVTYAEALGLSEALDLAVVEEILATLGRTRDVRIAANISGLSMQNPAFRQRLLALAPGDGRLLVELTETADITDTEGVAATLAALRVAGVEVCLDDFGAGYAAFRYLRDFRVDHVKIDGTYVRAATASDRDRDLVVSMREMAHRLGVEVIAEMVETEATASLMRDLGVNFGQGYFFGRPGHLPGARFG